MKYMQDQAEWGWTAHLLVPTLVFLALVTLVTIVMSFGNMLKNPDGFKKFLLGLLALGGVILLAWALSPSKGEAFEEVQNMISAGGFKWVGGGLLGTGILMLIAVIASLYGVFKNAQALKNSLIGIGVIGVLFLISWLLSSDKVYPELVPLGTKGSTFKLVGAGLTLFRILLVMGLLAIVWGFIRMIGNAKGALIGGGILLGIFGISYLISSDKVYDVLEGVTSPGTFKLVGAGLTMTIILFAIGLVLMVFDLIKGSLKS